MAGKGKLDLSGLESVAHIMEAGEKSMEADKEKGTRQAKTKAEKIAALEEKQKKLKAQIAKLQATDKAKERKADTRRKAMFGGFMLNLIGKNESVDTLFTQFLGTLKRDDDKALFDGYKK